MIKHLIIRINHVHERAVRTVYNDNVSTCEKLLEKDNSVTIHVRNPRILATELSKAKENLAAPIIHEIFEQKNTNITFAHKLAFS